MPKRVRMRSWLFRNRLRLRAIYGPRPAPPPIAAGNGKSAKQSHAPVRARTTVERHGRRIILRTRA
jgi:hypothetical protein